MPEPVVLLRTASPAPGETEIETVAGPGTEISALDSGSPPVPLNAQGKVKPRRNRDRETSMPVAMFGAAWLALRTAGRYPRASLAAGLSVPILAATLVLQPRKGVDQPGTGAKAPPVNAIPGKPATPPLAKDDSSSPSPSSPSPSPTTATADAKKPALPQSPTTLIADAKKPALAPSADSDAPAAPPLPPKDDPEPAASSLVASNLPKPKTPGKTATETATDPAIAIEVEPGSAPPPSPAQPSLQSLTNEADPAPPPLPPSDLHRSGPSLLGASLSDPSPPLPDGEEKGPNPSIAGLTPIGATGDHGQSPATEPTSIAKPDANKAPAPTPLPSTPPSTSPSLSQAPEPFKLTEAVVESSLPEPKVEPASGDPKSALPSGATATPPASKPTVIPLPIPVAVDIPGPPSNPLPLPLPTPPPGPALADLKSADPKPSSTSASSPSPSPTPPTSPPLPDTKPADPKPSSTPIPIPMPTLSASPALADLKPADPKPSALPAMEPAANAAPKADPPQAAALKNIEPTPAPELAAAPAAIVPAAASLESIADVPASKPPAASTESVVKASAPASGPAAPPSPASAPAPLVVPPPVPVPAKPAPRPSTGWIPLPSIGKLTLGREEDAESADGDATVSGSDAGSSRARRGRASDDVNLDDQPTQSPAQVQAQSQPSASASAAGLGRPRASGASRFEPNLHVVERRENFWTISRDEFGSGRYYRALWKANADKYPDINVLHVNDVIVIPAIEDLDPAYIDPPGRAKARIVRNSRKDDATDLAESASPAPRSPLRADDLDLPASDTSSNSGSNSNASASRNRVGRRTGLTRAADVDYGNGNGSGNDEPEVRVAARPRRTDPSSAPARRNVYKVRRNETLRSIARDVLGDYHRADEILELNRDVIKDPSQLVVGQLLEMPEDGKTTGRR